jgi:hypothetical protein
VSSRVFGQQGYTKKKPYLKKKKKKGRKERKKTYLTEASKTV